MPDGETRVFSTLSELTGKEHGLIVYRDIRLAVFCRWWGVSGIPQGSQAGYIIVGDQTPFKADSGFVDADIALDRIKELRIIVHPGAEQIHAAMEQAAKNGGRFTVYTIDVVKVMVLED